VRWRTLRINRHIGAAARRALLPRRPDLLKNKRQTLDRVSQLVTDFPEIVEMDINPLLVFPAGQGVLGLDMRLALEAK